MSERRLPDEGGSKVGVQPRSGSPDLSEVFAVFLARAFLQVSLFAFWPPVCPALIHKDLETDHWFHTVLWDTMRYLPRRHSDHGVFQGGEFVSYENPYEDFGQFRFSPQAVEVSPDPYPVSRVLGRYGKYDQHVFSRSFEEEGSFSQGGACLITQVPRGPYSHPTRVGRDSRQAELSGALRRRITSSPPWSPSGLAFGDDVSQVGRLGSQGSFGPPGSGRSGLVGCRLGALEWKRFPPGQGRPRCGVGFVPPGLRRVPGVESRRVPGSRLLDARRGRLEYKRERAEGGRLRSPLLRSPSGLVPLSRPRAGGQRDDHVLHQQDGRPVSSPDGTGEGVAFVVRKPFDSSDGGVRTRRAEHNSRQAVSTTVQPLRLGATFSAFRRRDTGSLGSAHYRLVRLRYEQEASEVLFVGLRRGRDLHQRLAPSTSRRERLREPAFYPDRANSAGPSRDKKRADPSGASVAGPAVVAAPPADGRGFAGSFAPVRYDVRSASLRAKLRPESANVGSGRLAYIRERLALQGISAGAISTISRAWSPSSITAYEAPWTRWLAFCGGRGISPEDFELPAYLNFLESQREGKSSTSYLSIAASSIGGVYHALSGVDVNSLQLVNLFRTGAARRQPPKPRLATVWDVTVIFKAVAAFGDNDEMSLERLRLKCVLLLRCDTLARPSDLEGFFRSEIKWEHDAFRTRFLRPKESRPGSSFVAGNWSMWILVKGYPPDRRVCSVTALKAYLSRTSTSRYVSDISVAGKDRTRGVFAYLPRGDRRCYSLGRDRITAITRKGMDMAGVPSAFTAYSTRAASGSMLYDAGAGLQRILLHGRWAKVQNFFRHYYRSISRPPLRKLKPGSPLSFYLRAGWKL